MSLLKLKPVLFLILFSLSFCKTPERGYDLIIHNGLIYDGSGAPPVKNDIAIKDDRIVAVGDLKEVLAVKNIDASGLVVAPGFIDLHAHIGDLLNKPDALSSMRQGITLLVGGPDGGSPTPFVDYLEKVNNASPGLNVAYQVGHNSIRGKVMGSDDRKPSPEELEEMKRMVEEGMLSGAFGFSTGLTYLPGTFSETGEVVELAKVAARYGGFYSSHIRDESLNLIAAVKEAIEIGEKADIPVLITHHKALGVNAWGQSRETLKLIDSANEAGLDIQLDQYPYTASSTGLAVLIPSWSRAGGNDAFKERIENKQLRDSIKAGIINNIVNVRVGQDISRLQFNRFSWKKELEGKTMADWAAMENLEPTPENAADLIIEAQLNGGASMIYHVMDEWDVDHIMRHPKTMIASDGTLSTPGENHPHPRSYGTFPRVLGHYVREKNLLSLEEAIHKMTGLPGKFLGLKDRGLIKENNYADIVIFNPETVIDKATFENPHQYPSGIEHVLVNGIPVIENGKATGEMGGRLLYGPGRIQTSNKIM